MRECSTLLQLLESSSDLDEKDAIVATVQVTLDTFEDVVGKDGIVVLDLWADWCAPCKTFGPVFESVSEKHKDIVFGKIDVEAEKDLAHAIGVSSIPTVMAFRDGILLFRESGALPAKALESVIEAVRGADMNEVRKKVEEHERAHAHEHQHGPGCNH